MPTHLAMYRFEVDLLSRPSEGLLMFSNSVCHMLSVLEALTLDYVLDSPIISWAQDAALHDCWRLLCCSIPTIHRYDSVFVLRATKRAVGDV